MSDISVFDNIEDQLNDVLNKFYRKALRQSGFILKSITTVTHDITSYINHYSVHINITDDVPFRVQQIRIPSTRIYLTIAESLNVKVIIVDYFNDSLLLVSNYTDVPLDMEIGDVPEHYCIVSSDGIFENNKHKDPATRIADCFTVRITRNRTDNWIDPVKLFRKWYSDEQHIHPFNVLDSNDKNFLEQVDDLWAGLKNIAQDRHILGSEMESGQKNCNLLFWTQEIYLYFYWLDELDTLYGSIAEKTGINDDITSAAYRRYKSFSASHDDKFSSPIMSDDIDSESQNMFDLYSLGTFSASEKIYLHIQEFWERHGHPLRRAYFKQMLDAQPDEVIAFSLMALKYHFWWARGLYDYIVSLLDEQEHTLHWRIWKLLWLLNSHVAIQLSQDELQIGRCGTPFDVGVKNRYFSYRKYSFSRRVFTAFNIGKERLIKIDKDCLIQYSKSTATINIQPVVWRPPASSIPLNTITLACGSHQIVLPLIWRSFTIECNHTRFKFLLKKKRYQISIRSSPDDQEVQIDNQIIHFDGSRYQRLYKEIPSSEPLLNVRLYDRNGMRINTFGAYHSGIIARGWGMDIRGQFISQVQASRNDSVRTALIEINGYPTEQLNLSGDVSSLAFHFRKSKPVRFQLERQTGVFYHLLNSFPEELERQMIIIVPSGKDEQIRRIRKSVFEQFRFYPMFRSSIPKTENSGKFYFITGPDADYDRILDRSTFSVIHLADSSSIPAIYVHENQEEYFFNHMHDLFIREI